MDDDGRGTLYESSSAAEANIENGQSLETSAKGFSNVTYQAARFKLQILNSQGNEVTEEVLHSYLGHGSIQ